MALTVRWGSERTHSGDGQRELSKERQPERLNIFEWIPVDALGFLWNHMGSWM